MNEQVKLVWITPDAEKLVAYMARVSNPENQGNPDSAKLISYLIRNKHWSPFEMVNACFEINTTRDIGRQILRHRSFTFQEFSGRYQSYDKLESVPLRECRMQDTKNRQNSLECSDVDLLDDWAAQQKEVWDLASEVYRHALNVGIAKEQARALLPEGLTPSRMYMQGTLRSWMHYIELRTDVATQKEHRQIAEQVESVLYGAVPMIMNAMEKSK